MAEVGKCDVAEAIGLNQEGFLGGLVEIGNCPPKLGLDAGWDVETDGHECLLDSVVLRLLREAPCCQVPA